MISGGYIFHYPLVVLFINALVIAESNNNLINARVDFHVDGNGFHRKINYIVDTGSFEDENCHLAIYILLSPALYVNLDELADLQRLGETTVCSHGEIDVELFAEDAGSQEVTLCSYLRSGRNTLSLPIHQRYQRSLYRDDYVNVTLPKPKLLLGCKQRLKKYPVSKIDLCSPCEDLSLKWREIPYNTETKDYIWRVPVGDLTHQTWVIYITLLSTLIGTAVVGHSLLRRTNN